MVFPDMIRSFYDAAVTFFHILNIDVILFINLVTFNVVEHPPNRHFLTDFNFFHFLFCFVQLNYSLLGSSQGNGTPLK